MNQIKNFKNHLEHSIIEYKLKKNKFLCLQTQLIKQKLNVSKINNKFYKNNPLLQNLIKIPLIGALFIQIFALKKDLALFIRLNTKNQVSINLVKINRLYFIIQCKNYEYIFFNYYILLAKIKNTLMLSLSINFIKTKIVTKA